MLTSEASVQIGLDLVGVFVFALSGGLVALRARLDLFGVLVLAWVTGLGGGIIQSTSKEPASVAETACPPGSVAPGEV